MSAAQRAASRSRFGFLHSFVLAYFPNANRILAFLTLRANIPSVYTFYSYGCNIMKKLHISFADQTVRFGDGPSLVPQGLPDAI
jgi:hypothetical protein